MADWGNIGRWGGNIATMGASELGNAAIQQANGGDVDWLDTGKRVAAGMGGWTIASALQGSQWQRDAANQAADRAQQLGDQGADYNRQAGAQAFQLGQQGQQAAAEQYRQALADYQAQQQNLAALVAPERQAGAQALGQLQATVLGGSTAGLALDPSYQFQAAEQQKALERRANAEGMLGSGGNIKDTLRMQQQMASRAYGDAIDRLMGIAMTGQNANQNLQSLNAGAMNNIMSTYGALAANASEGNRFGANTLLNTAIQSANARNNVANQVNQFNLQAANAQAVGLANANRGIQNGLNTALFLSQRQG